VCLMRVSWAFDSHLHLWRDSNFPRRMKKSKAAYPNTLGDPFWPKSPSLDDRSRHEPRSYHPPIWGHAHENGWSNDICYTGWGGRWAALLVGDPEQSFIWSEPTIH